MTLAAGLLLFVAASSAAGQSPHQFRTTLAVVADPVDIGSPNLGWHFGYQGLFQPSPVVDVEVLVSLLPTSFSNLNDRGSLFKLRYRPEGWRPAEGWSLTVYPFSSTRYRMGAEPLLGFGDALYGLSPSPRIASAVGFQRGPWLAELGLKTGLVLDNLILESRRQVAPFVRGRWIGPVGLSFELAAVYAPLGPLPVLAVQGIRVDTWSAGVAPRVRWSWGAPPAPILIATRERTAPEFYERLAAPTGETEGTGVDAELEWVTVLQRLENPDVFPEPRLQNGNGGKLRITAQHQGLRAQVFALARDVPLIQAPASGFPAHRAFPSGTTLTPELRLEAALDFAYPLGPWQLRPGVMAELLLPATFLPPDSSSGFPPGARVVVVRDVNAFNILPTGDQAAPGWRLGGSLAVELEHHLRLQLEAGYRYDPNRTTFRDDPTGVTDPVYENVHGLSVAAFVQGRL